MNQSREAKLLGDLGNDARESQAKCMKVDNCLFGFKHREEMANIVLDTGIKEHLLQLGFSVCFFKEAFCIQEENFGSGSFEGFIGLVICGEIANPVPALSQLDGFLNRHLLGSPRHEGRFTDHDDIHAKGDQQY
jgi:hypothetical protein